MANTIWLHPKEDAGEQKIEHNVLTYYIKREEKLNFNNEV